MRLRERLWRVALLGGLVTASAQLALGLAIPAPRWTLERAEPAVAASSPASIEGPASAGLPTRESSRARPPAARDEPVESRVLPAEPIRRAPLALPVIPPGLGSLSERAPAASGASFLAELERLARAASFPTWLALAALATALTVFLQLGLSAARLRWRLAGAVEIRTGPEVELLAALGRRARLTRPVRLFVAPRLCSPLSSGLVRPAVYVPPRALSDLSGEEREAMLAHELAHVARRDPAWLTLFWLVERACFFQPLNRLARRRLAHSAEVLADDWAVRYTGRHLSLASCLARIAGWMTEGPRLLGAHLANGTEDVEGGERPRSQLARRIERLLEGRPRGDERQRWWSPLALGVLGSLALVAPGVAAHRPVSAPAPVPTPAPRRAAAPAVARVPEPVVELAPALELAPAPAPLPRARRVPSSPRSPSSTPVPLALDVELRALDGEIELLEDELAALGLELADYEIDPTLAQAIDALEAHARALAARRDRLQAHTRPMDPDLPGVRP
jgi:Zn-dependent protease with chaperone function